jgi:hypothetical protein
MKAYISPQMQRFLTPLGNEEAVDQPLYHIQAYPQAGVTTLTFFGVTTGGYTVTNMDGQNVLSKGKRFGVFSLAVGFLSGQAPVQVDGVTLDSALNDAKAVLEGAGFLQFRVLDKDYLFESPLTRVPQGFGLNAVAGGISRNLAVAADSISQISTATNGLPIFGMSRKLRVPIPIPEQVKFTLTLNFPVAIPIVTAGQVGVWLDGMLIRAMQ